MQRGLQARSTHRQTELFLIRHAVNSFDCRLSAADMYFVVLNKGENKSAPLNLTNTFHDVSLMI
jgi:hypothetical protein